MPSNRHGSLLILLYDSLNSRSDWQSLLDEGVRDWHGAVTGAFEIQADNAQGSDREILTRLKEMLRENGGRPVLFSVAGLCETPDEQFAAFAARLNRDRELLRIPECWFALWMTPGRMDELGRTAPDFLSCASVFRPSYDHATLHKDPERERRPDHPLRHVHIQGVEPRLFWEAARLPDFHGSGHASAVSPDQLQDDPFILIEFFDSLALRVEGESDP